MVFEGGIHKSLLVSKKNILNFLITIDTIDMNYSLLLLNYPFPAQSALRFLEYTKHFGSSLLPSSSVVWLTGVTWNTWTGVMEFIDVVR